MVYRGKPSAGCENCRKAKKRCTLEQPACTRCVKLKKECIGYRDTTQLQIQDETQSVLLKVEKKKAGHGAKANSSATLQAESKARWPKSVWTVANFNSIPAAALEEVGQHTQASTRSDVNGLRIFTSDLPHFSYPLLNASGRSLVEPLSDSESQQVNRLPELRILSRNRDGASAYVLNFNLSTVHTLMQWATGVPKSPRTLPDDVAINMFLNCCTADGQWSYFHQPGFVQGRDACLDLAIKACGMAALSNVRPLSGGREWSRSIYTKAIRLLNDALKDPKRNRHDDCLVAVNMLGFYENLTCDGMQSIRSWKAHVQGATQLLKLRGRAQFNTMVGRLLYRELEARILVSCIWDDRKPPDFLKEWQEELVSKSTSLPFISPMDILLTIAYEFAVLRSSIKLKQISDEDALVLANTTEEKLRQWAIDTPQQDDRWKYNEIQVDDSPHVWEGKVYAYSCLPVPDVWNMYRSIRIMVSRTLELLARSVARCPEDKKSNMMYFRTVRRQMTDEICATIPCLLGHAAPAFCSPCVLITAYQVTWPVFFATTCAFERLGMNIWEPSSTGGEIPTHSSVKASAFASAAAQVAWFLGRLDYISGVIGVKWAEGIAGSLREAIKLHKEKAMAYHATLTPGPAAEIEYQSVASEVVKSAMGWKKQPHGDS